MNSWIDTWQLRNNKIFTNIRIFEDHTLLIALIGFLHYFVPSLQEYMVYRKHTYMRLDGSSKISERRDMVADFQSRWVYIDMINGVCICVWACKGKPRSRFFAQ